MIKSIFKLTILFYFSNALGTPTVMVKYPGLLGNSLFVFTFGKIVADQLGYNLSCQPIYGFPNTYLHNQGIVHSYHTEYYTEQVNDIYALSKITASKNQRNIVVQGYFQHYKPLEAHTSKIRDWLKIDPVLKEKYKQNPNDIVLHIRFNNAPVFVPFSFYEKALSMASYNQLYICTDEPYHPDLKQFEKYNPIIKSNLPLAEVLYKLNHEELLKLHFDDFLFITSFNKIISSNSTYSWWAAFLSDATEIYAPEPTPYGKVNESRYHYIQMHS